MCFSAAASFTASGVLVAAGGASLAVAKPHQRLLAAIPLLFGIQQFAEGVQWLELANGHPSQIAGYFFLFFAYALWPSYIPIAVYHLEKNKRDSLKLLSAIGILVSLIFLLGHFSRPLTIEVIGHSISYGLAAPFSSVATKPLNLVASASYLLVTLASLAISRYRMLRRISFLIAFMAVMAGLLYTRTYTSTWCFFAAVISVLIFVFLYQENNKKSYSKNKKRARHSSSALQTGY